MHEAWNQHIQPVLDASPGDNFSWVWDPFIKHYPTFSAEQRTSVENALVTCAFDRADEDVAVRALAIAEELHRHHLTSPRLSSLMRDALRKHARTLSVDKPTAHYYVFAYSTFELKEAVPSIKSMIHTLESARLQDPLEETKPSYQTLLRACCVSLLLLGDRDAHSLMTLMIEHEFRMRARLKSLSTISTASDLRFFWDQIGVRGIRTFTTILQGWEQEKLASATLLLKEAAKGIPYRTGREERQVAGLIAQLERRITRG